MSGGGRPIASAIAAYEAAARFGPVVVSKWPLNSADRSPSMLLPKSTFCASIEPDEYTYSRNPASCQRRRPAAASG